MLKNYFHFFRKFTIIQKSNITFIFCIDVAVVVVCGFGIMTFIKTNSMINYTILITTLVESLM